ncbi:hypothetical protein JST97_18640 [bacterium]|nr:hypothetical protein [bacterium]
MTLARWNSGMVALTATLLLAFAIAAGSRDFHNFDAALIGYTFSTLFAAFGVAYRYSMWLQRPPTAMYWRLSVLYKSQGRRPEPFAGREAAGRGLPVSGGYATQEDGFAQAVPVGDRAPCPSRHHSLDGHADRLPSQCPRGK